ncbi:MAG TPA: LamG-like jellyroll fold domain-containing protein [Candidatus Peribacterales bacterium]|nr:LamG-like jellyroll fold domain-containing protein [Candidatus Peribacterales bacterium]
MKRRGGFTLIELLVVIGLVAVLAGIVIVAVAPRKNFISARDAERKHASKQVQQAIYAQLIDAWGLAEGSSIPDGVNNAKPICQAGLPESICDGEGGVSLASLPPKYIAALPVDVVMPADANCTGYMVYQEANRASVYPANLGKLPGDLPSGMCGTGSVDPCPTPGMVARWNFNENAGAAITDSSGSGNNGTLMGTYAWSTDTPGSNNASALEFSGVSGSAELGDMFNSLQVPFSVSAWIYVESVADVTGMHIFATDDPPTDSGNYTGFWMDPHRVFYADGTAFNLTAYRSKEFSALLIPLNQWTQITAVIRGPTDISLYVEGVDQGGTYDGMGGVMVHDANPARIGRRNRFTGSSSFSNGRIDEVRIFNRALTTLEVTSLSQCP